MSLLDEWVSTDKEFQELEYIAKKLGYVSLKDMIAKHKDKTTDPKLTEELLS